MKLMKCDIIIRPYFAEFFCVSVKQEIHHLQEFPVMFINTFLIINFFQCGI